jgi:hypothetical protein
MKLFDLNIEKILENWEVHHAVREIIANGIDEQILTKTKDVEIKKGMDGNWRIDDFGRGIRYIHLTQNENKEKLVNPNVIGKFGIGLKDALATFNRKGIEVLIRSKHNDISLTEHAKEGFPDIITLHACVASSTIDRKGTEVILKGITDKDIEAAKNLFLRFSGEKIIERSKFGEIVKKKGKSANIYINGAKVAEEENFLFSYNITSISASIKKALNRERTNVGRTAYTDSVKKILLACSSPEVAKLLAEDLQNINRGTNHDELAWIDVQEHSVKILNKTGKYLFVTSFELMIHKDMIDEAENSGYEIIVVPENLRAKIKGGLDLSGNPIIDIGQFVNDYNDSFKFDFVEYENLKPNEKEVFDLTSKIFALIGGKPKVVKKVKISNTMRKEIRGSRKTVGIWDPMSKEIIILRDVLETVRGYAGTLIHEAVHAKFDLDDISREFESELTEIIGLFSEKILISK